VVFKESFEEDERDKDNNNNYKKNEILFIPNT
jgi:hypothetical protein